jgi:hypothetical protein
MIELPGWLQIVGLAFYIGLVTTDMLPVVLHEASEHLALVHLVPIMLAARYQAMKAKVCWGSHTPWAWWLTSPMISYQVLVEDKTFYVQPGLLVLPCG